MVPRATPDDGIALPACPACTEPQTMDSAARGSTAAAEQTGQVGDDPAQRVDELHGQVGPCRVPSGTGQPHLDADRPPP